MTLQSVATAENFPAVHPVHQPLSPKRILVVDDEMFVRQLISDVLVDSGYHVDTAKDGEAGWKALHAARHAPESYHLLITDNNMPKLSGIELIRKLRAERVALPIILASGTPPTELERADLTESLQPVAILIKPFSISDLMQMVKNACW